ncbi:MAG: hypothetical protein LBG72_05400 [Spirochaetaceae bacterium]|nr:hypothetical protein [Spirochaetaceae bacterium]
MPAAKTIRKTDAAKAGAKTKQTGGKNAKSGFTRKPAAKTAKKVTLDDVWATIDRIGKAHEEFEKAQRAAHQDMEKAQKETEKAIKETQKAIKETQRNISGISNTLGSLVEHIMTPGLPGKFKQFGFTFDRVTTVKWAVEGSIYTQIDGLLENGELAMVVEVKTTLRRDDIDEHLARMDKVRQYADEHGDKRHFLGAIAATITDKSNKQYALSKGFFVIEPSGDDVTVTKPDSQKVW